MATLQHRIAQKFLAKLAEADVLDAAKIQKLRLLLTGTKRVKADDLVKLFSQPAEGDIM